jgi:hypothetical protein
LKLGAILGIKQAPLQYFAKWGRQGCLRWATYKQVCWWHNHSEPLITGLSSSVTFLHVSYLMFLAMSKP